jgi:peptidoglycan/LPS O-acetylase OafA/YrhL
MRGLLITSLLLALGFVPTFAARRPARITFPAVVVIIVVYTVVALFVLPRVPV